MDLLEPCLGHVDWFVPSIEEACQLTGKTDVSDVADQFLDYGIKVIVVKMGEQGCYVKTPDEAFTVPAFEVPTIVDTLGAGDSFKAGVVYALQEGMDDATLVRFASATAAAACMYYPIAKNPPTMEAVSRIAGERFGRKHQT